MKETTTKKAPRCLGRVNGDGWIKEFYKSMTPDAGRRARELGVAGFHVNEVRLVSDDHPNFIKRQASAMGSQVTLSGRMNLTMLVITHHCPAAFDYFPEIKTEG